MQHPSVREQTLVYAKSVCSRTNADVSTNNCKAKVVGARVRMRVRATCESKDQGKGKHETKNKNNGKSKGKG